MERDVKVAAVMTAPRYENTYARNQIERSLKSIGIPLTVSGGVFYGQCMQMMLEQLAESDCDYAVTIDFDTLFTADQLKRLLHWIMTRDDIDAITGLQVRRGRPAMLGTAPGGTEVEGGRQIVWDGNPIQGTTAHFGLTVLDLRKLAVVERPWFVSTPDASGRWSDDKVDDDVHFWFQWKAAGNTVFFDPGVRLGHLEEMVAIHDQNMNATHIYPADWESQAYASATN